MNFEQFMSELYKIAIEHIKKAGPLLFLIGAIGLYFYNKLEATEAELKIESKEFRNAWMLAMTSAKSWPLKSRQWRHS